MTGVSQAVNEHLVAENARLTEENAELRNSLAHARDQWRTMASIVEKLERMDKRLDNALDGQHYDSRDRERELLRKIKTDKYSNTNSSPF